MVNARQIVLKHERRYLIMASKLYAGFGRECINPDFPVSLSGYGDNYKRPGLGRENTIYITCVAFKNEVFT